MYYNGQQMNLGQYVETKKKEYYANLKPNSTDYWEDENLIWAIQDYESCVGYADFSEEDMQWLRDHNLMEVTELFEED